MRTTISRIPNCDRTWGSQDNDPFITTYYFRTEFTYNGDPASTDLFINAVIDDGVVVYLNGQVIYRDGIEENPSFDTFADFSGRCELEGAHLVPSSALVNGVNVIAARFTRQMPKQ